jgi:outer membrane protein assembly factor BamB
MNGKVDFEFPFRSKKYESVNASCPLIVENSVMISATYRTGTTLLKLAPDFKPSTAWKMSDREHNEGEDEMGLHWTTPVFKDGHVYAFDGRNEPDASLVCVDHAKGKVVWRKVPEWKDKLTLNGQSQELDMSTLRGSLLLVDGRFLCLGELGHLLWLDLTPQGYKELDRAWIIAARETWALPIVSHGLLYVTQNTPDLITRKGPRLLCYDLRGNGE